MINWTNPNLALRTTTGYRAEFVVDMQAIGKTTSKFRYLVRYWPKAGKPYEHALFKEDGLSEDGTIRLEQVIAEVKPHGTREIIDTREWQPGRSIPLKNGTWGKFRRVNQSTGQIVGTYPTKLLGIVPFNAQAFWNDDGSSSNGCPAIDTKKVKFRKVES